MATFVCESCRATFASSMPWARFGGAACRLRAHRALKRRELGPTELGVREAAAALSRGESERAVLTRLFAIPGVRQIALEAARGALGIDRPKPEKRADTQPRSTQRQAAKGRKKGEKRSEAEIAKLADRLLAAITAKPGQRMEHLGKALGASNAELQIPIARLVEAKKITRRGEKRATTYFPAK